MTTRLAVVIKQCGEDQPAERPPLPAVAGGASKTGIISVVDTGSNTIKDRRPKPVVALGFSGAYQRRYHLHSNRFQDPCLLGMVGGSSKSSSSAPFGPKMPSS